MTTPTFAATIVTPIALAALFAAKQNPVLFLYYAAIGLLLASVSGFAAAYRFREERDLYRERAELLERECDAHAAENARLKGATIQVPLLRVVKPCPTCMGPSRETVDLVCQTCGTDYNTYGANPPDLTIVPAQRDGEHDALPVADYPFPVHTAVDDDDIEALIRATEEK